MHTCNPLQLSKLGELLFESTGSAKRATEAIAIFCQEDDVKPSIMMAAIRDVTIKVEGMPVVPYRRLLCHGKVGADGSIVFAFIP